MRQVFDHLHVGDHHGDLVALVDLDPLEAEHRRHRHHVDAHLVAVAHDLGGVLQRDAVLLGHLARVFPHGVVALPDADGMDLGAVHQAHVVRLGEAGAVMHELHGVAGDVDELVVLGLERADVQEAILRELVQRHQPLAVGLARLAHGGVVVAGLVVHVQLLDDRVDLLALVGALGQVDVPLDHLAVDEQRGVGVAAAVEGGVQRAQAQLRFGHHAIARLDLVVEQVVQRANVQHGHRGRQLAVEHQVDAVGRGVAAVRRVRHRDVAGVLGAVAAVDHRHAAHHLEVALLDGFLDALDVEHHHPVLLVGGGFLHRQAFLRVVAGREGILALVVGVAVVEVAVHQHLPGDLHGVAVQRGVNGEEVLLGIVGDLAVVGQRDDVLAVGEDVAGARIALRPQAVHAGHVGQLGDLVGLHHVQADAGDAVVGLVVDEEVAAVVGAVGERQMRVVGVAIQEHAALVLEVFAGLGRQAFGEDLAAFVGAAPAGGAAVVEDRDAHQFAHGRQPQHAHFARLAAGVEGIVFVQLARRDVAALAGGAGLGVLAVGGGQLRAAHQAGRAGDGGGSQEAAAAQAGFVGVLVGHG
ncbi:Uncharacterised protein [Achromobacter sp. 2789STDY5608621]|nr:Uncharacterised protein [Achromobacter sp. 2789STDY5608621]